MATTENQDNDELNEDDVIDIGEAPHFVNPNMTALFIRPSGNMVRIKCNAVGKHFTPIAHHLIGLIGDALCEQRPINLPAGCQSI